MTNSQPMPKPTIRVIGCFMEYGGTFLILQRHPNKKQPLTWGLPAGKVDEGEDDIKSAIREIYEETGYSAQPEELELIGEYPPFDFGDYQVIFPTYRIKLKKQFDAKLQPSEHVAFKWVTPQQCYAMPDLIGGFHELLQLTGHIKKT
jgi:8-oxo-dGTP pyrophosphatase MutT (NUDIX family)